MTAVDSGPEKLSRREREVADLVAEGLTNREIAERLVISERTAEGHVEQIRNKLGFRSRTQIATWVVAGHGSGAGAGATTIGRPAVSASDAIVSAAVSSRSGAPVLFGRARRSLVVAGALTIVLVAGVVLSTRPAPGPTLALVAGFGTSGFSGDGGPALAAQISEITSMGFDPDGLLVIADSYYAGGTPGSNSGTRVRRIDATGRIRTIVGGGGALFFEAVSGTDLRLAVHTHMAVGPEGDVYVAQGANIPADINYVGRVDARGAFSVLLGGWPQGRVPPVGAELYQPTGLAVGPHDVLYVVDSRHYVIRSVAPDGTVSTVVGNGQSGGGGDGGPPLAASISGANAIAFSPDGSLHIADSGNDRVRAIDHGGIIKTVAGGGNDDPSANGGAATRARLSQPADIVFGRDGVLYIADTGNALVRAVAKDGSISTVVGPEAGLVRPTALAVHLDGTLYIGDSGAHRIYKVVRSP